MTGIDGIDEWQSMMRTYREALDTRGSQKTNLLGVLRKALHHNDPNTFYMGMVASAMGKLLTNPSETMAERVGLVSRHMTETQEALEEIYRVAQEKGYTEITDIFEREYLVGHPSPEPTQ